MSMEEEGWGIPPLELEGGGPLPARICRALRRGILEGRFLPGSRLPSTRRLARSLGHSRPVVVAAYEQLRAEGWVDTRTGSGTFVSSRLPAAADRRAAMERPPVSPRLSGYGRRLLEGGRERADRGLPLPAGRVDLRAGAVDRKAFPWNLWRRLLGRAGRRQEAWCGIYEDPAGVAELRELLATYLRRQRGVRADAERILVVSGSQQALSLIVRVALDPGSAVAVEHPFYPSAGRLFRAAGARLRPVPVDDQGLDPAHLPEPSGGTRLLYVTPSHQFPRGCTLTIDRRLAILTWARESGALVVEDDYDGELRFSGRPVPSMQGEDREDRVVYVGSFSKVLLPELRLGYLVVPPHLVDVFRRAKWETDRHTSRCEQVAAAEFIRGGHLGRHIRGLCRNLASRRQALVAEIARRFGREAVVLGEEAGMHLMLRLPGLRGSRAGALRDIAAGAGVAVSLAGDCYLEPPARTELLLGYGGPLAGDAIQRGVTALRHAYDEVRAGDMPEEG